METRYISREECIKDLREYEKTAFSGLTVIGCISRIKRIPAADVRPVVRGEWIEDDYGFVRCSNCGMEWDEPEHPKTNYCPSCGADMRPEEAPDES